MSLTDEARQATARKGPPCTTGLLLARLTEAERNELQEALDDPAVHGAALHRALHKRGHVVPLQSLIRHRRGDCVCH